MLVDIIHAIDGYPLLASVFVEQAELLLFSINVKPANGLAVVVVQQDTAIALGIPYMNALNIDQFAQYRLDCK